MKHVQFAVAVAFLAVVLEAGDAAADTADVAKIYPVTRHQLEVFNSRLVARYGVEAARQAYNRVYNQEAPDRSWGSEIETLVADAAAQEKDAGIVLKRGDCRTSLCRFEFEMPKAANSNNHLSFGNTVGPKLVPALKNQSISVGLGYYAEEGSGTAILIVYSLRPPQHYVDAVTEDLRHGAS